MEYSIKWKILKNQMLSFFKGRKIAIFGASEGGKRALISINATNKEVVAFF